MRRNQQERNFGEWLDLTLSNRGITGRVIAEQLGVDETAVSRWRNSVSVPSSEKVELLADALELDRMRLLVTAGRISPSTANVEPYPMPEAIALRESVKRQISRIKGLSEDNRAALISTYDELLAHEKD